MKVLILGGTGMLGYPAALEFLRRGDEVEVTARSVPQLGPEYDQQVRVHALDVSQASESDLLTLMQGVDALVYALGPDDRETPVAPADDFFRVKLVEQTERVMQAARKAGVRRAVILGSYFCTFNRLHPEWRLAQSHPYIRNRVAQAMRAVAAGDTPNGLPRMDVMVLEIPYVFGVTPGRVPFWKDVFFERLRKMKLVMYPRGGSAAMTTGQIAEAIVGAVLRGEHGQNYPVADTNMDWNSMIGIIREEMGQSTRVINVPGFLSQPVMKAEKKLLESQGKESGLDPLKLMSDIMCRRFYIDPAPSRAILGYGTGGVEEALRETVWASYPA